MVLHCRMKHPRHFKRIQHRILHHRQLQFLKLAIYKIDVKTRIMRNQYSISGKFFKLLKDRLDIGCILNHIVIDIRQLLNVIWNSLMRIHEGCISVNLLAFNHFYRRDFNNFALSYRKSGGFYIEYDIRRCF
ncbi:hypothetical protein D3C74_279850 [compost metagenome]